MSLARYPSLTLVLCFTHSLLRYTAVSFVPTVVILNRRQNNQGLDIRTHLFSSNNPLAIEYDAAAKLAYDEWCKTYNKTPSPESYQVFQQNYNDITIANVKHSREFRDASIARGEGGAVVTVPKFVLDEKAGLTTPDDVGESAIREAYENWCRMYGRQEDESRYQVFQTNYLKMQEYAQKTGKPMRLTSFADLTKEEYDAQVKSDTKRILEEERVRKESEERRERELADETKRNALQKLEAKEAYEKSKKEAQEFKAKKAKELAEAAAAAERERKARQAELEKAAQKRLEEVEAAAIAAAKMEQETQAALAAKSRALEEESKRCVCI